MADVFYCPHIRCRQSKPFRCGVHLWCFPKCENFPAKTPRFRLTAHGVKQFQQPDGRWRNDFPDEDFNA